MKPLDDEVIALAHDALDHARAGRAEALLPLVDAGLPVNLTSSTGDTLLMLAAYHGHDELVAALLERGADPGRVNDRGQTILAGAAFRGHLAIVDALLDSLLAGGSSVDHASDDGRTALMFAAMFGRDAVVARLLERGADPAKRDALGQTAATLAAAMGATQAFGLLDAA